MDIMDIWDDVGRTVSAFSRASRLVDLNSKFAAAQLLDKRECGNCYFWMKSRECPREKNVKGYSRGPSCSGFACDKFQVTNSAVALKEKRLAEIGDEIKAFHEGQ